MKQFEGKACENCKGCYLMRDPNFLGVKHCENLEKKQKNLWCADETIREFNKNRRR